jgi:RsiW-degrading membrane proteinase PrsW (M82 family)
MEVVERRTSRLAVAGFLSGFLAGPIGLVLNPLALRRLRRSDGRLRGAGLAWVGLIASVVYTSYGVMLAVRRAEPRASLAGVALFATCAAAAGWLLFLRHFDRAEPEALKDLLKVGLLGGLMAMLLALVFNETFIVCAGFYLRPPRPAHLPFVFALFVGLNEEFWKLTATRLLIWRNPAFNEPVDALVYSLTVALGFATFENLLYLFNAGPFSITRALISTPAHLGFATLWGQGFAIARFRRKARGPFGTILPFWLLAAAGHGLYDGILFTRRPHAVLLSIALMVGLVLWAVCRLQSLEAESPFLGEGTCPECGFRGAPGEPFCGRCGTRAASVARIS